MNPILFWLSFFTIALAALSTLVDWVNLNHSLKAPLPEEFKDLYSEEKYAKAKSYMRERTKFSWLERWIWLVASLAFLWLGGFAWVNDWTAHHLPTTLPLPYFAALGILGGLFSLPFSWYSTFVIEEKFGFNRSSLATFLLDALKGVALTAVLGGAALGAVLWFFSRLGESAWLWAWGFLVVFQLVLTFFAPIFLLPLFNRFTPLPEGDLKTAIEKYASSVQFKLQGIFTMDGSRRSSKANAFFTGLGKFRRIVLFDTLVNQHSTEELVAVLAHEVGHYKKRHIVKGMLLSLVSTFLLFFLLSRVLPNEAIATAFGFPAVSLQSGFTAAFWFYSFVSFPLSILGYAFSRKFEYEADAFAAQTTGSSQELARALKKLSAENLSNLNPHPWKVWLEYSHPALLDRLRALK